MLVVGFLLFGLLYVGWLVSLVRRSRHTKVSWVVKHLQRHGAYTVKAGPFTNAWAPEQPSDRRLPMGFYQMPGRGLLTYSLDPDGETVRLVWRPRRGTQREWSGPIPVVATVDYRSTMHRGAAMGLGLVVALGGGGAVLGAFTGSVLAGLGSGLLAGLFVGSTVWSGKQMQAFRSAQEKLVNRLSHPAEAVGTLTATGHKHGATTSPHGQGHASRKERRASRAAYLIYGAVLTLGFVLGFVFAGGSGVQRFVVGVIGLVLAVALMPVLSGLIRAGIAIRAPKRQGAGKTPPA